MSPSQIHPKCFRSIFINVTLFERDENVRDFQKGNLVVGGNMWVTSSSELVSSSIKLMH